MKIVFGIDLGTTNTCVAKYQDGKFSVLELEGDKVVPSVVAWDGENFLVGHQALNYAKMAPYRSVRSVKRWMGRPHQDLALGEKKLSPIEISAKILSYVKERVWQEHRLELQDVVITVPAYFNDIERRATMQAGRESGLNVLRIMNEPTAASLVYELGEIKEQGAPVAEEEKWLIYDLGGGTFDVTLLSVKNKIKEVLSSCGNVHLGGDDFDFKLIQKFLDYIQERYGLSITQMDNPQIMADRTAGEGSGSSGPESKLEPELENEQEVKRALSYLRFLAERVKILLSTEAEVNVMEILPWKGQNLELQFTLTREDFEDLIQEEIDETFNKIHQALREANCQKSEVHRLILVGGSSKIPLISQRLKREFSLDAVSYIDADCSVALGAAIQAAILSSCEFEKVIIDVASHSLGIACLGEEDYLPLSGGRRDSDKGGGVLNDGESCPSEKEAYLQRLVTKLQMNHAQTFAPIIRRNAKLPAKFVETFYTAADNQTEVEIPVYQGESSRVRDNVFIGSFFVKLKSAPEGTPIRVGFAYDLNGTIQISVEQSGVARPQYFTMDTNRSAEMNLDSLVLHYLECEGEEGEMLGDDTGFESGTCGSSGPRGFKKSDGEGDDGYEEGPNQDSRSLASTLPGLTNLLIQKVEEKMKSLVDSAERERLNGLLQEYRHYLSLNLDEKLDELEDCLYSWMEKQEG